MMEMDENKAVRIKKLDALKAKGVDAYAQRFIRSHAVADILKDFKEGVHVVTAGRIMANRDQGKVHFMDLMDQIQADGRHNKFQVQEVGF